jgi:hypothetical protein
MTGGSNRDRNKRGVRRRDDSRYQKKGEHPKDVRTFFSKRKAKKPEREARFTVNSKTKRKEERLRAAEIVTIDENSEEEVDSDYEALCAVLDQQKKKKVTKTGKNS